MRNANGSSVRLEFTLDRVNLIIMAAKLALRHSIVKGESGGEGPRGQGK